MSEVNEKSRRILNIKSTLANIAPIIGLIITVVVFYFLSDGRSLSSVNLKILFNQFIVTAIVATGGVYAFSCGALDMSYSGSVCLSAVAGGLVGLNTKSVPLMFLAVVLVSMVVATFKGVIAAFLKLPVFIVTIVFGSVLSAIALVLLGSKTIISLGTLFSGDDTTLVTVAILVIFYLVAMYIFNYTKIGKSCKLQGGNALASGQSGINAKKNIIIAFLMGGLAVALAAIVIILRTKTASASTANTVGTDMMIAIVLGGMPLVGGPRSRISAGIIGAATITVLNNGLQFVGLDNGMIQVVRGVIFLVVVFITSIPYRTKLLPR